MASQNEPLFFHKARESGGIVVTGSSLYRDFSAQGSDS